MNVIFNAPISPDGAGRFALFSPWHAAWVCVGAAVCVALCGVYRRKDGRARRSLRLCVSGGALAMELLRAAVLIAAGEYTLGRLPLHLCAMSVYFMVYHALSGNGIMGQFLYALSMPGAASALLFPDWGNCPPLSFLSVSGFGVHILLVGYPLMLTVGGDIRPDIRKARYALCALAAIAVPVYAFNILAGTNFMFLRAPAPNSPMAWFAFLGEPWYLAGLAPVLALVWAVLFWPFRADNSGAKLFVGADNQHTRDSKREDI